MYQLTVRLLDENNEVLNEYKPEPVILDPDTEDCLWKQVGDPEPPSDEAAINSKIINNGTNKKC